MAIETSDNWLAMLQRGASQITALMADRSLSEFSVSSLASRVEVQQKKNVKCGLYFSDLRVKCEISFTILQCPSVCYADELWSRSNTITSFSAFSLHAEKLLKNMPYHVTLYSVRPTVLNFAAGLLFITHRENSRKPVSYTQMKGVIISQPRNRFQTIRKNSCRE